MQDTIAEPILLTSAQFGSLMTAELEFSLDLPEYPVTQENGYTYCVSTTSITDIKQVLVSRYGHVKNMLWTRCNTLTIIRYNIAGARSITLQQQPHHF
jgi:hypothetical protein